MPASVIEISSEQEMQNFAIQCAEKSASGDVFLLTGPLGAGKSVFARSFIQYLAREKIDVPSPTFTLVQTYNTQKAEIWHFDLYRLEDPSEIYELGWEEALANNILLIEWPERLGSLRPETYKEVIIEPLKGESRKITFIEQTKGPV